MTEPQTLLSRCDHRQLRIGDIDMAIADGKHTLLKKGLTPRILVVSTDVWYTIRQHDSDARCVPDYTCGSIYKGLPMATACGEGINIVNVFGD